MARCARHATKTVSAFCHGKHGSASCPEPPLAYLYHSRETVVDEIMISAGLTACGRQNERETGTWLRLLASRALSLLPNRADPQTAAPRTGTRPPGMFPSRDGTRFVNQTKLTSPACLINRFPGRGRVASPSGSECSGCVTNDGAEGQPRCPPPRLLLPRRAQILSVMDPLRTHRSQPEPPALRSWLRANTPCDPADGEKARDRCLRIRRSSRPRKSNEHP